MSAPSPHYPHRHAEFTSASMARGLMMVFAKKWILNQVQGDEIFRFYEDNR